MYFFSTLVNASFEDALLETKEVLRRHGFEVLANVDMQTAFKKHLALDFRPYLILGAYVPKLAHRGIQIYEKMGSVLVCNVVVQQHRDGRVEISMVDPETSMYAIGHIEMDWIVRDLRSRLRSVIEEIEARTPIQQSFAGAGGRPSVLVPGTSPGLNFACW